MQQVLAHRKQAAEELDRRRALEKTQFSRTASPAEVGGTEQPAHEAEEPEFVSVWDLMQQARELACWVEQHRDERHRWRKSFGIDQDDITVEEMMDYLRRQLAADESLDGIGLLESQPTASHRSCLFLRMLEMAHNQKMNIIQ